MKSTDTRVATWIKALGSITDGSESGEQSVQLLAELRRDGTPPGVLPLMETIARLAAIASADRPPTECLRLVAALCDARCPKSSAALAALVIESLASLPFTEIVGKLPDEATLELWRKTAKIGQPELVKQIESDTRASSYGPTLDWLLHRNPPGAALPTLIVLLDRMAVDAAAKSDVSRLQRYLLKDPKSLRLSAVLRATAESPDRFRALALAVRSSFSVLANVAESLPRLAQAKAPDLALAALVRGVFSAVSATDGRTRAKICGVLGRIGSGLLLVEKLSLAGEDALRAVAEIGEDLRNVTRDATLSQETWIFSPLSVAAQSDGVFITMEGARRWAFAVEEAERSGAPVAPLETLGFNLGLRPIDEVGRAVVFEPRKHQDVDGGLLPGDPAMTLSGGWSFNERPLIRARVRRAIGT